MAKTSAWHKLVHNRVFRFVLSSGSGFLVDVLCFYILYTYVLVNRPYVITGFTTGSYTLALCISFFLGVLVNFLMAKYIVFAESELSPGKQFTRFVLIAVIGFFANLLILKLMIETWHINAPVARILTSLSLFIASYFIHKIFSFNLKKQ